MKVLFIIFYFIFILFYFTFLFRQKHALGFPIEQNKTRAEFNLDDLMIEKKNIFKKLRVESRCISSKSMSYNLFLYIFFDIFIDL